MHTGQGVFLNLRLLGYAGLGKRPIGGATSARERQSLQEDSPCTSGSQRRLGPLLGCLRFQNRDRTLNTRW